jgi:hypothetical protein
MGSLEEVQVARTRSPITVVGLLEIWHASSSVGAREGPESYPKPSVRGHHACDSLMWSVRKSGLFSAGFR